MTANDTVPSNLPAQTTPLIGRTKEVGELCDLLQRPDVRLVTLVGPPGTGKTRLALEAAARVLDRFADGVWFVPLVLLQDAERVPSAVAQALGVLETGAEPLRDRLAAALREQHALLALDNFEQVTEAGSVVADLLAACPRLTVVVTSRAPLKVYGEHEFPVLPLAVPDLQQLPALPALEAIPSVALFLERARSVKPDFAISMENARVVAEICARLDGLPLAIELAAARVKLFPPRAIVARLQRRLDLLTGGAQERPARQQTLRAAIGWSYDLLSPAEQTLFRRLAVFAGGSTLEAAEAVCSAAEEPLDLLDGLTSLVDKNLLGSREQAGGEPRFHMLETIRAYALEQLGSSQEAATIWQRHAEYFLRLAEAAEGPLDGPQHGLWLDRLEREHDNLRSALQWALDSGHAETALRLAGSLWRFWFKRGLLSEGQSWLDAALALPDKGSPLARSKALNGAGNLAGIRSDLDRARTLHEEALAVRQDLGDTKAVATSLNNLANVARLQGDSARAIALHERSLAVTRDSGDRHGTARSLHNLALVARDTGDYARARALHEESLAILRSLGDEYGVALALNNLGYVVWLLGDRERAEALQAEALSLYREQGDTWGIAHALLHLASVEEDEGDRAQATALFVESLGLFRKLGVKRNIAVCLEGLARLAAAAGSYAQAATLLGSADLVQESVGVRRAPVEAERHARATATIQAHLGNGRFATAWEGGRAMPMEQAIDYALAVAEETRSPAAASHMAQPHDLVDPLTQREREVVRLLARGLTNRQIAHELVISEATAAVHVKHVLGKLGVESRAQAAIWAVQRGLAAP